MKTHYLIQSYISLCKDLSVFRVGCSRGFQAMYMYFIFRSVTVDQATANHNCNLWPPAVLRFEMNFLVHFIDLTEWLSYVWPAKPQSLPLHQYGENAQQPNASEKNIHTIHLTHSNFIFSVLTNLTSLKLTLLVIPNRYLIGECPCEVVGAKYRVRDSAWWFQFLWYTSWK